MAPGVSRDTSDLCYAEDKKTQEDAMCSKKDADDIKAKRAPDGSYKCDVDYTLKPCGDGLNPGLVRTDIYNDHPDSEVTKDNCKDAEGKDAFPICGGDVVERDPTTGEWNECKGNLICGDGLNPGVSRENLPVNSKTCKDADGNDEVVMCSNLVVGKNFAQKRNPTRKDGEDTKEWLSCEEGWGGGSEE